MPSNISSSSQPAEHAWIRRFETELGSATGPLSGLRFAVKDNIDVAHFPTTAGCAEFAYTPDSSAHVVQKLLNAGAKLVGKTNLDQFACGLNGTRSPFGSVPNAFSNEYVSGGSSSGSAYVVATGEVDFALGTDTAGSGRVPAGLNNIVGLKPSRGLISCTGVVPAAQSVDTVSIFASNVPLAWRVLQACMGYDPQDPYSRTIHLRRSPFSAQLRVGIPDDLNFFGDTAAEAEFEKALSQLKAMGAQLISIPYAPFKQAAELLYGSALVAERHAAIKSFFDQHESQVIEPVRHIIAQSREFSATDVFEAQHQLQALTQAALPMWLQMDVLVVPTAPTHYTQQAMQNDPITLNRHLGYYTNFVNLLDYAALSVPSSIRPDGLPFGITLIAPSGSDWALAEIGTRYHARTGLNKGNTAMPLQAHELTPPPTPLSESTVKVGVVGAHLSGMPLNGQLVERGARLLETTQTAPLYRFYALDTHPPKPGLIRATDGKGSSIALEIWEMPLEHYGSFVALIPAPLGIGRLQLIDGQEVQGFLCESYALLQAHEITAYGGWRAYQQTQTTD